MSHFTATIGYLLTILFLRLPAAAQQNVINTVIGGGPSDMPAVAANLYLPVAVALDNSGNYYIAAFYQNRVFKVDTNGKLTVLAGTGIAGYSGDGVNGGAPHALLNGPTGLAVDSAGNIYIADDNNFVIRKVDTTNTITTIAGSAGVCGFNGDGQPATNFSLCRPIGVALDAGGNLYIADSQNCRIRKLVLSTSTISTYAGTGTCGYSGDTGSAVSAQVNYPSGIAVDTAGNLFIADTNNYVIRTVVKSTGQINKVAGSNTNGYAGDAGLATAAQISTVYQLSVNGAGTKVTIADVYNSRIRQFTIGGNINTVAGSGTAGFCGDNAFATAACLYYPQGVALNNLGDIFIADSINYRIRRVDHTTLNISTIAGNGSATQPSLLAGIPPLGVVLAYPFGVMQDPSSNVFVADTNDHMVRELVQLQGVVNFFAGTGAAGYNGDFQPAVNANLSYPSGVAHDSLGNIYVADTYNHVVREVDTAGNIRTVAGTPQLCGFVGDGGPATSAKLCYPYGVFVDSANNLYIADTYNHAVREVTNGTIKTIAGVGVGGYSGDGGPAASAQLRYPYGVAVDGARNVFIADSNNCRVREISAFTKIINTTAGNGFCGFTGDGPAAQNSLAVPNGVQVDSNGNLFIADTNNQRLRWVDTAGNMTTIAGTGTYGLGGDGGSATSANLAYPSGIFVDSAGNFLVADQYNFRIRGISAFAALNRSTSSLSFGLQSVATTSSPQIVKLSALGPLTISGILMSGDFTEADNCPSSLPNGSTCTIYVYFSPKAAGARTGAITINDNGYFSAAQTINLTGSGTAISITGTPVVFANQLVKTTSAAKSVTIKNYGATSITMGAITLNEITDFAISANSCPASGQPLPAHASCTVSLTFGPQSTGLKKGTLLVNNGDPSSPQIVGLSGTGISNVLLSPGSITFAPAQAVGTFSKATTVTLTNNTGASLTMGNPALTVSANFVKAAGTTCTNNLVIPAAGKCVINVVFNPTAAGYLTGTLSVADTDVTAPQTVSLEGTGTALKFAPASVNFGNVTKGTQVSTLVTMTNVGTTTLTFTGVTLSGTNSADFTTNLANPPCAGTLAAGANCSFTLYFTPSIVGAEKASLNTFDNTFGSPQVLPVAGTGQ